MKKYYRVSDTRTNQGLWYDMNGKFTGLIHGKFSFCANSNFEMPFDEGLVGWLSATDSLDELFEWFPKFDIIRLQNFGYKICEYEATEIKEYKNHLLINQESSKLIGFIDIYEVVFTKEVLTELKNLKISMSQASEALKKFSESAMKANPKRFIRQAKIEQHISDINVEIGEALFDEGLICDGCELHINTCEGSNCGYQMESFLEEKTKSELGRLYFQLYGDRWNNLSMRIKNELKKQ